MDAIENHLAAPPRHIFFANIHLRHRRRTHRRKTNQFHHRSHGVGGELPATRPRAGAGMILNFQQLVVRHLACRVRPHRFKHLQNRNIFAPPPARKNRATVKNHTRNIEPKQRHSRTRNRFIARHQRHNAIEHVAPRHQFNGIRNHFTADQ